MNKRKRITILIMVLLAVALASGIYFIVSKKIFVSHSKNISVAQLSVGNGEQDNQPAVSAIAENQDLAQQGVESKEMPSDAPESIPVVKNSPEVQEKVVEKKVEDAPVKQVTPKDNSGKIVSKFVSFGFQKSSGRTIKAIIVHTSYNAIGGDVFDFSKVLQEWKDAGVSPHYAIDRDGTTYQLVADQNIAWHAGSSKLPDGTTDVNGVSIGIEVVNDQNSKFTDAQYSALNNLIATLKKKYPIKYVLGHDDIAPDRKSDPWGIEWKKVDR